jgi:hypothetical protein
MPQLPGFPLQLGPGSEAPVADAEANTESFLLSRLDPQ